MTKRLDNSIFQNKKQKMQLQSVDSSTVTVPVEIKLIRTYICSSGFSHVYFVTLKNAVFMRLWSCQYAAACILSVPPKRLHHPWCAVVRPLAAEAWAKHSHGVPWGIPGAPSECLLRSKNQCRLEGLVSQNLARLIRPGLKIQIRMRSETYPTLHQERHWYLSNLTKKHFPMWHHSKNRFTCFTFHWDHEVILHATCCPNSARLPRQAPALPPVDCSGSGWSPASHETGFKMVFNTA